MTFNYDTLVESAFGALGAVRSDYDNGVSYELEGKQIVYPAPRSGGGSALNDIAAADDSSFQLLKLHGSLSWYWPSGGGSTVVQDRVVPTFGQRSRASATEVSGLRTLDRFLIPPVLIVDAAGTAAGSSRRLTLPPGRACPGFDGDLYTLPSAGARFSHSGRAIRARTAKMTNVRIARVVHTREMLPPVLRQPGITHSTRGGQK